MAGARRVVVKVGGSLLNWPPLPERLRSFLETRSDAHVALVMGGGPAADLVRELDRHHHLGEERAHALALRALDLTAYLLADLVPNAVVVADCAQLTSAWHAGQVPVLACRAFLAADERESADPLPHSWAVTSDAIAARLAARLGAAELVLLKSAPMPPGMRRDQAVERGLVDRAFPAAARGLARVIYRNLREPGSPEVAL